MTTLKQICIEHGVRLKEQEYVRLLAKEWLEQKRQDLRERKNTTDREAENDLTICLFINELLAELKGES